MTPAHDHNLFYSVYSEEEKIRVKSLVQVGQDSKLEDELSTIEQATKLLVVITQNFDRRNDDEGLIIHLGIRLTNLAFSAVKLALSGYYQQSLALARDITETGFLIHYLTTTPLEMEVWRNSSEEERKKKFSPVKIRIALDKAEGTTELRRAKVYAETSELGAHASPRGFNLLRSDDAIMVGPFFEIIFLRLCVREIFMRLCPATHIITSYLNDLPDDIQAFNLAFSMLFFDVSTRYIILPEQSTGNGDAQSVASN